MTQASEDYGKLYSDLEKARYFFLEYVQDKGYTVHIYTHRDADGLSAGAILGKALYREKIPFQISVLKQLEREEIIKIANNLKDSKVVLIFSDFGSGPHQRVLLAGRKLLAQTKRLPASDKFLAPLLPFSWRQLGQLSQEAVPLLLWGAAGSFWPSIRS